MSRFSSSVRNEAELADHLHAARLYLGAEFREIGQRMGLVDERTDNDPVRCRGMPLRDRLGWTAGDGFDDVVLLERCEGCAAKFGAGDGDRGLTRGRIVQGRCAIRKFNAWRCMSMMGARSPPALP